MLTGLTRLQVSWAAMFALTVLTQYNYWKLRREYLEAIQVLQLESNRSDYLLELFNKYDIPVDEFEKLALKFHHISVFSEEIEEDNGAQH